MNFEANVSFQGKEVIDASSEEDIMVDQLLSNDNKN